MLTYITIQERAQEMTVAQLTYAIKDCNEAAEAAWSLEQDGYLGRGKGSGVYLDEMYVYAAELRIRQGRVPQTEQEAKKVVQDALETYLTGNVSNKKEVLKAANVLGLTVKEFEVE